MDIELTSLALSSQRQPYERTTVQSGGAALTLLRSGLQRHLILLDLNVPGLHGLEVPPTSKRMWPCRSSLWWCSAPPVRTATFSVRPPCTRMASWTSHAPCATTPP